MTVLSDSNSVFSRSGLYPKLYPELAQYMGLSLSEDEIHKNMSVVPADAVSKTICFHSSV